jgi:hypothetical protein
MTLKCPILSRRAKLGFTSKKGNYMNWIRYAERATIAVGLLLLLAAPAAQHAESALLSPSSATTQGGSAAPVPAQDPSRPLIPMSAQQHSSHTNMSMAPQKHSPSVEDELSTISLTDDQKAKIDEIGKDTKTRIESVARDEKETSDQKQAMIEGLQRIKLQKVYLALTPVQRAELRKKVLAERAAEQARSKPHQQSAPK